MQLYQKEIPTQVFSCDLCDIFKSTYLGLLIKPGPKPWTGTLDPNPGPGPWTLDLDPEKYGKQLDMEK